MSEDAKIINASVKGWDQLSGVLIGVVLTLLTIYWTWTEPSALASSCFVISFLLFANSTTVNRKVIYENAKGQLSTEALNRWMRLAEFTYGIAYTALICGFTVMAYEVVGLGVAILTNAMAWLVIFWYNQLSYDIYQTHFGKQSSIIGRIRAFINKKGLIYILIEAFVLIYVIMDSLEIVSIP